MEQDNGKKINPLRAWYLKKRFYMKSRPMIRQYQCDDKKYLLIVMCGWHGEKWGRRFEIVSELDDNFNPVPFSGPVLNTDQRHTHDTK